MRKRRVNVSKELRKLLYEKYNYTCGHCGNIKHEQMIPLQIHHIDDNPMNTVEENLIPLCVSCHRKTMRQKPIKQRWLRFSDGEVKPCGSNQFLIQL